MAPIGAVAIADVLTVAAAMTATAIWSARVRRFAVVDATWGAARLGCALVGAIVAEVVTPVADDGVRRWLVTALVIVWGGRLAGHLLRRVRASDHDDPRYEEMLGGSFDQVPFSRVVGKVFLLQGVALLVVAAPLLVGQVTRTRWWWAVALGAVVWGVGIVFESVGDAQLAAYRRRPDRGPVLDTGLWALTRHPNYFGDFCVWWGVWGVGGLAGGLVPAVASLPGPLVMTWFLIFVSGARPTDKRMRGRPGWADYEARTPMFFPRPPFGRAVATESRRRERSLRASRSGLRR